MDAKGPPNRLLPTLSPYQPTLRDRAANKLLDLLGDNPRTQRFVQNLLGSTGLGQQHPVLADFTGLTLPFQADEAGRQIAHGHPVAGGANMLMAAVPLPAAARVVSKEANRLLPAATKEVERAAAPIVAYHGSPRTFDEFSLDHIGSGEGAQAYGHGLYFAENEDVARGYRDRLGNGKGSLYQVGINAPESRFLDWDTPLGDHHDDVQNAVLSLRFRGDMDQVRYAKRSPQLMNRTAGSFLNDLATDTPGLNAQRAAEGLAQQGVAGVKYLDYGSRGLGAGTRNFVVFNPSVVDIMKRYGVAAPVAASMLAAQQLQPQAGAIQ